MKCFLYGIIVHSSQIIVGDSNFAESELTVEVQRECYGVSEEERCSWHVDEQLEGCRRLGWASCRCRGTL